MTVEPKQNLEHADLDLQAMLYVLGDPAIDRLAFESTMESTPEAMESVARAVEILHGVRGSLSRPQPVLLQPVPLPPAYPQPVQALSRRSLWLKPAVWPLAACSLAASLLTILAVWKPDAEPNQRSDWSAIASAWSDVHSTEQRSPDSGTTPDANAPAFEASDLVLASFEHDDEPESIESDDIPSWLIIAASSVHPSSEEALQ